MYKVEPMPGDLTEPSVTIHNWSSRLGINITFVDLRQDFAFSKWDNKVSDQEIDSEEERPPVKELIYREMLREIPQIS